MTFERALTQVLLKERETYKKMIFVGGPRQVGKTTLFQQIAQHYPGSFLNWDRLKDRKLITHTPEKIFEGPAVYLDEIHKFPRWKNFLKGNFDTQGDHCLIHVTGSARLDVYRRGGDSLLGRYILFCLHPFSMAEILKKPISWDLPVLDELISSTEVPSSESREAWVCFTRFGGFPEPFLSGSHRRHQTWLHMRHERLVRDDIRDMSRIREIALLETLVQLLPERAANLISLNSLREILEVSYDSIRLWMQVLEEFYYVFFVSPYSARLTRALKKERKMYLWDWSEIEDPGARFENMVASHLLKWCHYLRDTGIANAGMNYLRDKEKREVDFLITNDRKPWFLVEAKQGDPNPSPDLIRFARDLGNLPCVQVVNDFETFKSHKIDTISCWVISAPRFLTALF